MNSERSTLSPEHRHLTRESIMRIQITLSSRKSSVVVFNTHARLVAVGEGKWDSVAVGAPCIILLKETSAPDSPFQVRFAIAEIESGIAIWEEEIGLSANYTELQPTFHTFTSEGGDNMAVQLADAVEASSLLDCLHQYILQKQQTDQMLEEKKSKKKRNKKSTKLLQDSKRLSKIDISSPCEFRHLSGIAAGHPQQDLEATLTRRQRSSSMSAISSKATKQRGKLPKDMTDGKLYKPDKKTTDDTTTAPPPLPSSSTKRTKSGLFKSSSVRVTKKRGPFIDHIKSSDDSSISSTPSHAGGSGIIKPPGATSSSSSSTSQVPEHSYWSIDDLQHNRRLEKKLKSMENSPEHEQQLPSALTFKNSAPSQIQQAWRNSLTTEDTTSSKSSRSSTPHLMTNSSASIPNHTAGAGFPQPASGSFRDKRNTWSGNCPTTSPAHSQLNTSPDHQSPPLLPTPPHLIAAANAKKYMNTKPTYNTYDMLAPLSADEKKKLPPLPPIKKKPQPESSAIKENIGQSSNGNETQENEIADDKQEQVAGNGEVSKENSQTSIISPKAHLISPRPPPLTIKEVNGVVTPPNVSSPGDLDVLSAELSRVLKDFDSLVSPNSPLEPSFQYPVTKAKETMV